MANDCLQTKLKSVVANGNLRKLDEFTINYSSASNTTLIIEYASGSGHTMADIRSNGVTFVLASGNASATVSGTGKVFIPYRDSVVSIIVRDANGKASFDDTFHYVPSLNALYIESCKMTFGLSLLSDCNLIKDFRPYNNNLTGNISQLLHLKDTLEASLNFDYNTHIEGSMTDLGKFSKLTTVRAFYTAITGDIVDFVHSRRDPSGPNQSTGSISFRASEYTKFNGNNTTTEVGTLSWTATTITWNGETITA